MLKEKLKTLFAKKEGESNKKRLENIVVFITIKQNAVEKICK